MKYSILLYIASGVVLVSAFFLSGASLRAMAVIIAGGLSYALFNIAGAVASYEEFDA